MKKVFEEYISSDNFKNLNTKERRIFDKFNEIYSFLCKTPDDFATYVNLCEYKEILQLMIEFNFQNIFLKKIDLENSNLDSINYYKFLLNIKIKCSEIYKFIPKDKCVFDVLFEKYQQCSNFENQSKDSNKLIENLKKLQTELEQSVCQKTEIIDQLNNEIGIINKKVENLDNQLEEKNDEIKNLKKILEHLQQFKNLNNSNSYMLVNNDLYRNESINKNIHEELVKERTKNKNLENEIMSIKTDLNYFKNKFEYMNLKIQFYENPIFNYLESK